MFKRIALLLAAAGLLLAGQSAQAAAKTNPVLESFVKSLPANPQLTDAQRKKASEMVGELRKDEYPAEVILTEVLGDLYPAFSKALIALGDEQVDTAIAELKKLTVSKDAYLAAESTYYLARAHILNEKYETALPLLTSVVTKLAAKTTNAGPALFLQGVTEAAMLKRAEAKKSLEKFLKDYPNAPERMQVGAFQQLERLKVLEAGSIVDVHDHMEFSRRKLKLIDTAEKTQGAQKKIIAMLDKLIKEAEKKECNCSGSGQGSQGAQGKGQGGGDGKESKGGQGNKGGGNAQETKTAKTHKGGNVSPWSHLRDKKRDVKTFSAIKSKFPARYQRLMEQYSRSIRGEE